MNPELKAGVSLDRTIDRAEMAPNVGDAYDTFAQEIFETRKQLSPEGYKAYLGLAANTEAYEVSDVAIGYALNNFEILDSDSDDQIEPEELVARKNELASLPSDSEFKRGELPPQIESRLIENLEGRFSYLSSESKDGTAWSLGFVNSKNVSGKDLEITADRIDRLRSIHGTKPLYDGPNELSQVKNMPASVKELLQLGGMSIESVPGSLSKALAKHKNRYPTVAIAAGLYSGQTNEIISERGEFVHQYRQHEIGHFIDDALEPGLEMFSTSDEFKAAVKADMANMPEDIDWRQEIPSLHLYIAGALNRGEFTDSSLKELFADLYQTNDTNAATKLREYFPNAARIVDEELQANGIERFPDESILSV